MCATRIGLDSGAARVSCYHTDLRTYIRIRNRNKIAQVQTENRGYAIAMNESEIEERAETIRANGERVGIPVSEDHARLAAKWGDPTLSAIEVVRELDYQKHEPGAVFRPVVLSDESN